MERPLICQSEVNEVRKSFSLLSLSCQEKVTHLPYLHIHPIYVPPYLCISQACKLGRIVEYRKALSLERTIQIYTA